MRYHGQMSLQIAILVAFTQLIPEHQVQFLGVIKARVKVGYLSTILQTSAHVSFQSLPMAYLTLSTVLCFIGLQCPWIIIQFGWFVGWIYLRFYKKNPNAVKPPSTTDDGPQEIEAILDSHVTCNKRGVEYLVSWVDYPDSSNQWLSCTALAEEINTIVDFHKKNPDAV